MIVAVCFRWPSGANPTNPACSLRPRDGPDEPQRHNCNPCERIGSLPQGSQKLIEHRAGNLNLNPALPVCRFGKIKILGNCFDDSQTDRGSRARGQPAVQGRGSSRAALTRSLLDESNGSGNKCGPLPCAQVGTGRPTSTAPAGARRHGQLPVGLKTTLVQRSSL